MNELDQIIEVSKYCGWLMIEDANTMMIGDWVGLYSIL